MGLSSWLIVWCDLLQLAEDYLVYHAGAEDSVGVSLHRPRPVVDTHSVAPDVRPQGAVDQSVESLLPPLSNLSASLGDWQPVAGTR